MDALSNTYALQQADGAGAPVGDSAHLESLLAPNRTCVEMFEAARKLFAHRTWRRKDYEVGGFWKRGKLCLDLVDKAQVDPFVVEKALSLDCDCIFSALEGTECGMRRTDYQHRGVWDRSKLRRHINVELQPVADGSFHVVASAQGDAPFECSSDGSDVSELVERFEDDDDEAQSDGPDAERRFGMRPRDPDHPPPGYLRRTRSRVSAVKRNRRTSHRLRHVHDKREVACIHRRHVKGYPWASHRRQVWE